MYKIIIRFLLLTAILICVVEDGTAQYYKSIKIEFDEDFENPFIDGEWEEVDMEAVQSTIMSRVTQDFSPYGISVSEETGNMIVKIGLDGTGFGLAYSGLGSFVSASNIYAEVYSENFSNYSEWQGANATVARIAEAIAGTASHEAAHLLNCYHAYASHTFDPAISNHLNTNHTPKEPEALIYTTGDDYAYKYFHLLATRGWITLDQRAEINRSWSNLSDLTTDFGTDGGSTITYNTIWGLSSRSWTQAANVTVNSTKTMLIGAPSYTHNLNGKYIKAAGTGKITLFNGLSGSYWKITNSDNTELYGLYPSSASAIANVLSGQYVRDANNNVIYPEVPTIPTNFTWSDMGYPRLSWSASTGADSYTIKRVDDNGTFYFTGITSTSYDDETVETGEDINTYEYSVKAVNQAGSSAYTDYIVIGGQDVSKKAPADILPTDFGLSENYPNPFNPTTQINYQLPKSVTVTLKVYNITGQVVATLVNSAKNAGYYTVIWDASDFASGTYIYKLTAGSFSATKRMAVIK
jgi:hypothetical protein